ncbi:MAG: hypothetical protein KKF56_00700 [Nanoarchaeota archaeon]|nr:hypothetical protein [Nanoarchaeota archaeon]
MNKNKQETKALVLFSGGLDSRLAIKVLQDQLGKENVEAVFFQLPFGGGCCSDKLCVFRFTQKQRIKLHVKDVTKGKLFKEYINMLRNPEHTRGTALNPCIDCHLFMFKKAKSIAKKIGAEIIATGEVLGERPLSQHKKALIEIETQAKLKNKILRPLSAKLLPETDYEKKGLIDRSKLLDIKGRRRVPQIALAKKYKIDFPTPGGGCLLCEKEYCKKLEQILPNKDITQTDIELLSIGRHFEASKIILGKNHQDNLILEKQKGIKITPQQPGPTALVKDKSLIEQAKKLIQKYSKHKIKSFS